MEKIRKIVVPCGYLRDPYANHYFLLTPHPIPFDNWLTDGRQAWQAVKCDLAFDDIGEKYSFVPVGGVITVICSTQSTVELCTVEPIEIDGYDWEAIDAEAKKLQEEMEISERVSAEEISRFYYDKNMDVYAPAPN